MTDSALIEFFKLNADYFENNGIVGQVLKFLEWSLIRFFVMLADGAKTLFDAAFGVIDFTTYKPINDFIEAFKPFFIALMALSLLALAIMLIAGNEKKPKILRNIVVACLCVSCSTAVFQGLNDAVKGIKDGVDSVATAEDSFDGPYDVVEDNLTDLIYLDDIYGMKNLDLSDSKSEEYNDHRNITKENFKYIDYDEVMNYKTKEYDFNSDGDAETILKKKMFSAGVDSDGTEHFVIRDVYNGFGWNSADDADLLNEFYFRYQINFFNTIVLLASLILVYVALAYKCVRIAFELVVARLLAYLYSAELSGGQKVAKILVFIRDSYIMLIMAVLCVRVFYFGYNFVMSYTDNALVQIFFILFIAFAVIDGPNLVEKLLGMDLGLSSSIGRMMAGYSMAKAGMHAASAPFRAIKGHRARKRADKQHGDLMDAINGRKDGGGDNKNNPFSNTEARNERENGMRKGAAKDGENLGKNMNDRGSSQNNFDSDKGEAAAKDMSDNASNDNENFGNPGTDNAFGSEKDYSFMNKAGEEKNKGSVGEYMNQKKTSEGTSKDPGFKQRMQNGYNDKYMKQKGQKPKSVMSEKRPPNMKSKFMGPNKDKK